EVAKKHKKVKLLLAGNGPEHDNLVKLIKDLQLNEHVELLGYRIDLEEYVNICDLVVSASYREGLPLNIMEAMVCGKPVIASDNRGHRELIKNNENGILINLNEENTFSKYINLMIENDNIRRKFAENGLLSVEPFKVDNVKSELINIYKNK
ncbi:MAG: glycosyltransferase, partial [Intestinibacter sp.]|uniref:glycosyltransferase n=1 Tax=Intestinibacter sp. TaxID=1965304 RepID=UPI003F16725B